MIEIKNVTQIGAPREEDKIYIENLAYTRLREKTYEEKRVFVLMGHTERMEGKYATFVEAVIPIREMEFAGATPQWNNSLWSQVFKEIKRFYEEMIIVGWVVDIRGMRHVMNPDLERVHREHFGGVHQLLLLMDSLEQEETFYIYKENKLVPKDGFYIYYRARKTIQEEKIPEPQVEIEADIVPKAREGQYRKMLSTMQPIKEREGGNAGLAIAVAVLAFVIIVGAYENRDSFTNKGVDVSTEAALEPTQNEIIVEEVLGTEETESGEEQKKDE